MNCSINVAKTKALISICKKRFSRDEAYFVMYSGQGHVQNLLADRETRL